jgi:DNA-binding NarL/FixJ family response regulator
MPNRPIRTLIVDDHPAMRAGVATVLDAEEDITVVGAASGERQLWPAFRNTDPDVVLMDFDLDGEDGIILCHRLKRLPDAPGVVVYTAFADRTLISPAMLAHADALLSKRASAQVLCEALRDVAATPSAVPVLPADERERLGAILDGDERSLAALLLSRRSIDEIAKATGRTAEEVDAATERLIRRLAKGHGVSPPTRA